MTDNVAPRKRSEIMSKIGSKWTTPERTLHNKLKANKVRHEMHPNVAGNPDLILKDKKVAVFIDGCFFHRCPKCFREPHSNLGYWLPKIDANVKRDKKIARRLRKVGWKVIRLWEHEILGNTDSCIDKIIAA